MRTDFSEVSEIWGRYLWDARYDFKAVSSMLYLGGYDGTIPQKYEPVFFKVTIDGETAGVISGHATSEIHFRSRGLFVFEKFRGRGVSRILLGAVIDEAKRQNYSLVWAAPRLGTLDIYEKVGFKQTSDFTTEGFTYGPNCYAAVSLK